ncbi:MAG: histidine kinase, partial [Nitrospinaceae bacterium]|nr:histidine kinase [Nitrospinaceae bacterium]NIR57819.1 histidine kinase [Nitrospinaceae bacterium]NIS88282.1 histidine kinase [Nitrospinaceae bacterium]NIT85159.1 histidine kinase [Nitrospinaceae bacterium]NIU47315.1 histidine kinase [Nitrospinaceae bacterium]
ALKHAELVLYMNTSLNQGHFHGRGKNTLLLPVLARDEEPQPSTQESMFNFVRLSDGGLTRYPGPRSEVSLIADIAEKILPDSPIPWGEMKRTGKIREMIGAVVPGFEKMKTIDQTREEFHIGGRVLHQPRFPTEDGKARFKVCELPPPPPDRSQEKTRFRLMTVRSEGQFNTVVYDLFDRYRGTRTRNVVLM